MLISRTVQVVQPRPPTLYTPPRPVLTVKRLRPSADVTRTTARDIGMGEGTLHLDADVGFGRVVVVRDPAPMASVPKLGWDPTL